MIRGSSQEAGRFQLEEGTRQVLLDISRDLREALRRSDRMRQLMSTSMAEVGERADQTFNVLVADLLKANLAMHDLCIKPIRVPPAERLITLNGYLKAAQRRADEVNALLQDSQIRIPDVYNIMMADLKEAATALGRTTLADIAVHGESVM